MFECECYHEYPITGRKVCWGTKEIEDCGCGGDESKCDFYPEVKIKALLNMSKEVLTPDKEYEFEVGDIVVTSDGKIGVVDEICRCDRCASRGFYEPLVSTLVGNDGIYITDNDKRTNFRSFYKIGKHLFGNINMDDVKGYIENETRNIDEASTRLRKYHDQLDVLEKLRERNE